MIATGVARRVVTVRSDPVLVAAARLDQIGESLRAMSVTAGGSLTRAAPEVGDESTTAVCNSAAAAGRIRLAGFGDWSASLAGRLRQAVQTYAGADAAAAHTVTLPAGSLPGGTR